MHSLVHKNAAQLRVIHFSDVHFGRHHFFNPSRDTDGELVFQGHYPSLADKLLTDLDNERADGEVILCVSGDFAENASSEEFKQAQEFILKLLSTASIHNDLSKLFICPGNHDVVYDKQEPDLKWAPWHAFYQDVFDKRFRFQSGLQYVELHDRFDPLQTIVLTINTSMYIQKDTPDQNRGAVGVDQLTWIEQALELFKKEKPNELRRAIKIAMMHHHPILIPALAEPGRRYDAVLNSGQLLSILRRFGFHLVLHGHKHNPHTFTNDVQSAFERHVEQPMYIVCGGSVGSEQLPRHPKSATCYNIIDIKWHAPTEQTRIRIKTRGLSTHRGDGSLGLPGSWTWQTIWEDDRRFLAGEAMPKARADLTDLRAFDKSPNEGHPSDDDVAERQRIDVYRRARGNLAVVEVLPSLDSTQIYEARVWIVQHPAQTGIPPERPAKVVWRAGPSFEVITVHRQNDPNFAAVYHYYGPMLVQASMHFDNGDVEASYVYVRIPQRIS